MAMKITIDPDLYDVKLKTEYEFKGQKSIDDWTKKIDDIALSISFATDKRGLCLFVNPEPMVCEFLKACEEIKKNMNASDGPCGLIPGSTREE